MRQGFFDLWASSRLNKARGRRDDACIILPSIDEESIDGRIFDILPFLTDASRNCSPTRNFAIRERLARTRKCQELFRMVILPNLSYFGQIFLVRNGNCVATLFIANLPIPENGSYLEISKFSSYPPPSILGAA